MRHPLRSAIRWTRRLAWLLVVCWVGERGLEVAWPYPSEQLAARPASRVFYAADGSLLRVTPTVDGERSLPVSLENVSPHVVDALIAAEDQRFRSHSGVDPAAIVRAALGNLAAGRVVSGASTLTMQVVRLVEPRPRDLAGKIAEALRARQLERLLSKDAILAAYLNRVPFGGTTRGIEAAAQRWYGKRARDLNLGEAAALVAMLPAPTARAPDLGSHADGDGLTAGALRLAAARREVLARMESHGVINVAARRAAASQPLPTARRLWPYRAPHACDLFAARSRSPVTPTTIDVELQTRVEEVARSHDAVAVDGLAVVVLDRTSGELRAMLGSRDYRTHPLNAATCRRSAGSTLKPFLYALALDAGIAGPEQLVRDTPIVFRDYAPRNFEGAYRGALTASDALATSRNLPAIRLLRDVGPERFADLLRTLGFRLPRHAIHVDAALGTISVSPLELARAYQRLASPDEFPGLSQRARDQVIDALSGRTSEHTLPGAGPVAWKTGTSSGRRDAWCAGITAQHVIVVWLGRLDGTPDANLVGGRVAADLLAELAAAL